jgi:hypothetical protein
MASFTLSQIGMYDSFAVRPPSRHVYAILAVVLKRTEDYKSVVVAEEERDARP